MEGKTAKLAQKVRGHKRSTLELRNIQTAGSFCILYGLYNSLCFQPSLLSRTRSLHTCFSVTSSEEELEGNRPLTRRSSLKRHTICGDTGEENIFDEIIQAKTAYVKRVMFTI
ncbi:hypothetical protein DdX_03832 [Ditylenchus destructor]|uniref:Uncharacterized protein n=1 Tax=Ditylenchus destructor TaxID=166010 RepID=A0AAD4NFP1_9BILA|nr:hypothetical protein DdX_03832 [Ditylenchus destructor]